MGCARQRRFGVCALGTSAALIAFMVLMAGGTALSAQDSPAKDSSTRDSTVRYSKPQDSKPPDLPANAAEISPNELVRTAAANEVAAANHPAALHMFRSRRTS